MKITIYKAPVIWISNNNTMTTEIKQTLTMSSFRFLLICIPSRDKYRKTPYVPFFQVSMQVHMQIYFKPNKN